MEPIDKVPLVMLGDLPRSREKWILCKDLCLKKKKKAAQIYEAIPAATPAGTKTLHFLQNTF